MTTKTANISNLLAPGLRKVFFDVFKGIPTEFDKIANMLTSERNYEDDFEMSMLGGSFPTKDEGVSIQYVDPVTGNTKRYTHSTYGLGFRITEEAYEDDLYKTIGPKAAKGLAKAARNATELRFIGILDDAWAGAIYTGFDGHVLCHAAHHILYTGGTFANTPTTQVDLGVTALQAAILNVESQPDSDGVIAGLRPQKLIIAPDNRFIAKELLKSELKPFSSTNEINSLKDEGLSFMVTHFLTDTDAWFLLASVIDINFFWRRKTRFDNSDDFDTGDAKFKGTHRHSQGFGDARGVYGSSGG